MKNRSYSSGIQISSKSCEMAFSIKQLHRIKLLWFNVPTGSVHKKEPTSYIFSQRMKKKPLLMAENFSAIKPRRAEFPYSVFGIFRTRLQWTLQMAHRVRKRRNHFLHIFLAHFFLRVSNSGLS